ncbi:helix-turn-helix domain-containing protein [Nostocoides sp. F2B08]|uniref:winged helix-turn-helix domain-containing protein n=1 Tax=Nostocoides sp. F2B08 TaxID=2653936 RepID=UPI00186B3AC7|nr:helix-turn-helix domain-containing protein [Tetrasphaera sp. F2B08]
MTIRKPPADRAREIDAATLKAFAHPLRIRMYDYLKDHGAATASTLAEAMGESSGQTSYHLRQLAKHGLIAEDASRGTARERWWEAQGFSFGLEAVDEDPAALTAVDLVMRQGVEERRRRQLEWIDRQRDEERRWQEVVSFNEATVAMTPEELHEVCEALGELVSEHVRRAKASRCEEDGRPANGHADRRTVKIYTQLFPLPPEG